MHRIGSFQNRVTILVNEQLWLQSSRDDLVGVKMKQSDVASHLRQSFRGAVPIIDALSNNNVQLAQRLILTFSDISYVGNFRIMNKTFPGELESLWGYKAGSMKAL